MKIKICGLRNEEDSLGACQFGADMLGFNFFSRSSRMIEPVDCQALVVRIRKEYPKVLCVGVFVNHSLAEIRNIIEYCELDMAQLSGNEKPKLLQSLNGKAFKVFRPQSLSEAQNNISKFPSRKLPPAFLIDSNKKGHYGGTGRIANWEIAAQIAQKYNVFLAGGLSPENIEEAIGRVNPWGVDVASGVESVPGVKDLEKIRAFIEMAKQAAGKINPIESFTPRNAD